MASIPGAQFNITGASGSQGLLGPKSSWRCYVFPRGGYASQDSTGALITFDSASVASRFAASDWIQAGTAVANIRQVSAVGGNSLSVSGAALTISENMRIFLIGTTEPSVVGGSATYTPASTIRQRDDDAADTFTNSMVTSNADGLIQFFSDPAMYDCLIQDGNQANQGAIIDLPVGAVEGISTGSASTFGTTVTFNGPTIFNDTMDSAAPLYLHRANAANAAFGVTGVATFNSRVQFGASFAVNGAIGVTGPATFGTTVTLQGNIAGISSSGVAVFGQTVTMNAALGVTGEARFSGHAKFITTAAVDGNFGITGSLSGVTAVFTMGGFFGAQLSTQRLRPSNGVILGNTYFTLGASWGDGVTWSVSANGSECHDQAGCLTIVPGGSGIGANPMVTMAFANGNWPDPVRSLLTPFMSSAPLDATWIQINSSVSGVTWMFVGTPVSASTYSVNYLNWTTND